ncbi:hypothetical protein IIC68_00915 [archaeon]|nr:hypothetical protein [archaeon]
MSNISREEFSSKAKEINAKIFGRTGKKKRKFKEVLKEQVDEAAKFALEKAFLIDGLSPQSKKAFLEILQEQTDAINILFAEGKGESKAVEMLEPLFKEKTKEFIQTFKNTFNQLQLEINSQKEKYSAS